MVKTKKPKQKKVSERRVLDKWRAVVLANAKHLCEYPGCTVHFTQLHPHHYFNKNNRSVKYDPLNGICLCHIHHTSGNDSAHLDPDFKEKWLKSGKRPTWWLDELTNRKNTIVKDNDAYRAKWDTILQMLLDEINSKEIPF